jgi:hypothetical protein
VRNGRGSLHDQAMIKRGFATALWFVATWVMVSALDFAVVLPSWIAPVVAMAVAALIAFDPRHLLWSGSTAPRHTVPRN